MNHDKLILFLYLKLSLTSTCTNMESLWRSKPMYSILYRIFRLLIAWILCWDWIDSDYLLHSCFYRFRSRYRSYVLISWIKKCFPNTLSLLFLGFLTAILNFSDCIFEQFSLNITFFILCSQNCCKEFCYCPQPWLSVSPAIQYINTPPPP